MRILLINHQLRYYFGTELYARDIAIELKKRGHDIFVFSPVLGDVSSELRDYGIEVADKLTSFQNKNFDIIHAHHNVLAIIVRSLFTNTPIIYVSHGPLPELEQPPSIDIDIGLYIAVSEEVRDNLVKNYKIKSKDIRIIRNFANTEVFKSKKKVNNICKKLLVLSNHYFDNIKDVIEKSCKELGIQVVHVGLPENPVKDVKKYINECDIVVTIGKGVLEAMSCERNVIVYDMHGGDGFLTPENYLSFRKGNFSGRTNSIDFDTISFKEELRKYDPKIGKKLRKIILGEHALDSIVSLLEGYYLKVSKIKVRKTIGFKELYNEISFLLKFYKDSTIGSEIINELNKQVNELNKQVNELNKQIKFKGKENAEIIELLNQKDSEIKLFMKKVEKVEKELQEFQGFKQGYIWRSLLRFRKMKRWIRLGVNSTKEVVKHPKKIIPLLKLLFTKGPRGLVNKIRSQQDKVNYTLNRDQQYEVWLEKHLPSKGVLEEQKSQSSRFKYRPKISIITPVYNTGRKWLRKCIESVQNQTYDNWELCLADDASTKPYIKDILKKYSEQDSRIKVIFREQNGHICRASNSALQLATGEFIGLLDHDDELAPQALFRVVEVLNKYPNTDFVYSDEDKLELDGRRTDPHFKPGWSLDKLYSFMYAGHLSIYKKEIVDKLRGFRPGLEGSQDYDLLLRASKFFKKVYHIEDMLYHWRKLEDSTALTLKAKPYALLAAKRALQEDLKSRVKSNYQVDYAELGYYIVSAEISKNQKVDIFIKEENKKVQKTLEKSLKNRIERICPYKNIDELNELIERTRSDFSFICNDEEAIITNSRRIFNFVGYLNFNKVAVIGPKILDRKDRILSAGLILSQERIRTPFYKNNDFAGYSNNLIAPSNYYGIDSGLFAIDNHIFKKVVKKFNPKLEQLFVLDASIKLWKHHYRTVFWPLLKIRTAQQISYDSPKVRGEYKLIIERYKEDNLLPDPFYNSNFSLGERLFEIG